VNIRPGKKQDLPRVFELVKELALFEKAPHEVTNTVARMEEDGFGANPIFGFFVRKMKTELSGFLFFTGDIRPGREKDYTWKILS
jgi:hypothetical protein